MGSNIPLDLDIDYLVKEYRAGRSANDLAGEFGVSVKPITDRLKSRGIEIRGQRSQIDVTAVRAAYRSGLPVAAVARHFKVSHKVVVRILREFGIEPEDRSIVRLPVKEVIRIYRSGIGAHGVAERFGCAPSTICRVLRGANVPLRNRSEQQQARMDRASPNEIGRLTAAAHDAARGRKVPMAELIFRAQVREERQSHISPLERKLASMLRQRGIEPVLQKAIGPYNCDLAVHPVAVEIFGGGWHWHGHHLARKEKRFRYILNAGWHLLAIPIQKPPFPLTPAVADYVSTYIKRARRDPSLIGQYRVVWGAGEFSTGGSLDDEEISIEPPFTNTRDPRTGQYKRVPR